jgi:hypothetical protein
MVCRLLMSKSQLDHQFPHRKPSRPGEFHPEALTDSGREPLDSSGSCHRLKAAAFRPDRSVPPVSG